MPEEKVSKAKKVPEHKPSKKSLTQKNNLKKKLQHTPASQLNLDDLRALIVGMNEVARRDGIKVLEGILPDGDTQDNMLRDGLQLAIDQYEPSLIAHILTAWKQTYLQQQEARCNMIIEGVDSILVGDNPRITDLKLRSYFDL